MTDTEILKEIKERAEKATKGNWFVKEISMSGQSLVVIDGLYSSIAWSKQFPTNDAEFIAHAYTDISKLIEIVERENKALQEMTDYVSSLNGDHEYILDRMDKILKEKL